jgi:hypothetical protein
MRFCRVSAIARVKLTGCPRAGAYVLQGDSNQARAAYQNYLALWEGADPDIFIATIKQRI